MTSSRQLVRSFFRGAACPRPPLLPMAFYHAARLEETPVESLVGDSTRMARVLLEQHELLGTDGVAVRIDAALLAELAGVPVEWTPAGPVARWEVAPGYPWPPDPVKTGSIESLLDVMGRLQAQLRRQAPVVAILPGPTSLSRVAYPDSPAERLEDTVSLLRGLAEEACRAGAEVVIMEEKEVADALSGKCGASQLEPIYNTVRYYNAFPILCAPIPPGGDVGGWNTADVFLLSGSSLISGFLGDAIAGKPFGIFVPDDCFRLPNALDAFAEKLRSLQSGMVHPFLSVEDRTLLSHSVEDSVAVFSALREVRWA